MPSPPPPLDDDAEDVEVVEASSPQLGKAMKESKKGMERNEMERRNMQTHEPRFGGFVKRKWGDQRLPEMEAPRNVVGPLICAWFTN